MNNEPTPRTIIDESDKNQTEPDFSGSLFYPKERDDLKDPPAGYIGELPGGNPTSESMPSTAGQEDVDDELDQPTAGEFVTEVPGFEGNGATEPRIIDTDADQEAIARKRQSQAAALYTQVAGQIALPSLPSNGNNPE